MPRVQEHQNKCYAYCTWLLNTSLKSAAAMLLRALVWCVWWPLSIGSDAIADYCFQCSCNNFDNAMPILGIQKVFVFTSWRLCGMRKCSLRKKLWKNRISVLPLKYEKSNSRTEVFFARGLFHSPLFTRRSDRTNDFGGGGLGRNQLSRLISKRIANAYTH